jgi:hypothetical protein
MWLRLRRTYRKLSAARRQRELARAEQMSLPNVSQIDLENAHDYVYNKMGRGRA